MIRFFLNLTLTVLLAGFLCVTDAAAQSTVFSMPSTDILPEGKIGLRFGAKFKINTEEAKKPFSGFTPRVIYGLRKNVEIGLNVAGNVQPGIDNTTLVPTVKWRPYYNEEHRIAIVVGNHFYLPVHNKKYNYGSYSYVQASKQFSTGTRITAGTYLFSQNVVAKNASRAGGQFAVEHPLNKRFIVAAEYYTGKHSQGYLMPGLKIKLNKRVSANVGYTIMNQDAVRGNHYFYAALGVNLK